MDVLDFVKTEKQSEAVRLMGAGAKYILLRGGSRSGKTFIIIRQIILRALKVPGSRHLVVRFAFNHAKQSLWYDTIPKVLKLCFPGVSPALNKSDWFLEFPNGSQIWLGGLDDKERTEKILGNEYASIFLNENSHISYSSYTMCVTRLAQKTALVNKIYCDCNPTTKAHWSFRLWFEHKDPTSNEPLPQELYATMQLNPSDNLRNLPDDYITSVLSTLSRNQQKRFLHGEYVDEIEGALWKFGIIDPFRVIAAPEMDEVVIAVDPSGSGEQGSDEAGIVAVGKKGEDAYVLQDRTGVMSPDSWARTAIEMYHALKADAIIAEANQGWEMVRTVINGIDRHIPVKLVNAQRGKVLRAEPVVAKYEQGKVHHVGMLPELEDQMTTWAKGDKSPGRIDALVHGVTHLLIKEKQEIIGIGGF